MPLEKFESMLKTNSVYFFDAAEFEEIIDHYIEVGKHALAKKALILGLEQHPNSLNLQLLQAEILIFENQFEKAEYLLEELVQLEPSNAEVLIQQAELHSKQTNHESAIELLLEASKHTDDLEDIWLLLGMEYIFLNRYREAINYLRECLKLNPSDFSSLFNVVYCFEMLNEHKQAVEFLEEYLDENPYCEIAWHQLGRQYIALGKEKDALRAFDYACLIDDQFVGAFIEKAKVLEKMGRYDEAILCYEEALSLEDATAFTCYRTGRSYEKKGDTDRALEYFAKASIEDPLFEKSWLGLVRIYAEREDYGKAVYYLKGLLDIDSESPDYWYKMGVYLMELGRYKDAEESFFQALSHAQEDPKLWLNIIDDLIKKKRYDSALLFCREGMKTFMNQVDFVFRYGALHYHLGNESVGNQYLSRAQLLSSKRSALLRAYFKKSLKQGSSHELI
jgi:tetratricopeptide (TPR) repeat protein